MHVGVDVGRRLGPIIDVVGVLVHIERENGLAAGEGVAVVGGDLLSIRASENRTTPARQRAASVAIIPTLNRKMAIAAALGPRRVGAPHDLGEVKEGLRPEFLDHAIECAGRATVAPKQLRCQTGSALIPSCLSQAAEPSLSFCPFRPDIRAKGKHALQGGEQVALFPIPLAACPPLRRRLEGHSRWQDLGLMDAWC